MRVKKYKALILVGKHFNPARVLFPESDALPWAVALFARTDFHSTHPNNYFQIPRATCSNSNSPPLSLSQGGGRPVALPTPCPTAGPISHASPAARIPLPRSEAAKVDNGQCAANGGHAWACPGAQLRSRSRPAHALFTVGTLPIIRVSTRTAPERAPEGRGIRPLRRRRRRGTHDG